MVGPIVPSYDNLKITLVIPVIITTDNVLVSGGMCVTQPSKHSLRFPSLSMVRLGCWKVPCQTSQSRVGVLS